MQNILLLPFTNKTNLFTLVVVTLLFAAFRLSGGSIFGSESSQTEKSTPYRRIGQSPVVNSKHVDSSHNLRGVYDFVDSSKEQEEKKDTNNTDQVSGLDEIENMMGL